jgi:hypothetical protein
MQRQGPDLPCKPPDGKIVAQRLYASRLLRVTAAAELLAQVYPRFWRPRQKNVTSITGTNMKIHIPNEKINRVASQLSGPEVRSHGMLATVCQLEITTPQDSLLAIVLFDPLCMG